MATADNETTETQHTPGEWRYEPGEPGDAGGRWQPPTPDILPTVYARVEGVEDEVEICTLTTPAYRVEPADEYDDGVRLCGSEEANGRLIAAAPELLAALRRFVDVTACYCTGEANCETCQGEAAINKALTR